MGRKRNRNNKDQLDSGLKVLSQAATKADELVSELNELKSLCDKLDTLGGKWTYVEDGEKTESEVRRHNEEINGYEKKVASQESLINSTIAAINGMQFSYTSHKSQFSTIMKDLDKSTDLEARKREFIGSIDDDSYVDGTEYRKAARTLGLFDNKTGDLLKEGDRITVKVGEKRVITVKLPTDSGHIDQIVRTSAWKHPSCTILNTYSDIDPDPNNVEYVNLNHSDKRENHMPSNPDLMHQNYYEWVIEGVAPGTTQISQTCLFTRQEGGPCPKTMVDIHVDVVA